MLALGHSFLTILAISASFRDNILMMTPQKMRELHRTTITHRQQLQEFAGCHHCNV
jgi:hypothetical protein